MTLVFRYPPPGWRFHHGQILPIAVCLRPPARGLIRFVAWIFLTSWEGLAGELPTHPDASPVYADVQGLAPILVQIGENEVMLSDAIRLASNLGEARVRTTLEVWPGMFHVWHLLAGILPEADQALRNAVRFLADVLTEDKELNE